MAVRGIGRLRAAAVDSADEDATAWAAAVTANSGTYSAETLAAVDAFCVAAKANSYWDKLNRINLICGNQLAAALVPLKAGDGDALDTNVNFLSGDYTEAGGLDGNLTSKYLRTGLIPSASLTLNSTHMAYYGNSAVADSGGRYAIGAQVSADVRMSVEPSAETIYSDHYDATAGTRINVSVGRPEGFIISSRTAINSHRIYQDGAQIAADTDTATAQTLPNIEMYVHAINSAGSPSVLGAGTLCMYSIGAGLTAQNAADFYTDIQVFQTALSRNV